MFSGRQGGPIKWSLMGKTKRGMLDEILRSHAKDKKQAPNVYFKTEKGHQLEHRKFSTDQMFTTKKNLVS